MRRVFSLAISVLVLIALVIAPACAPANGVPDDDVPEEYNLKLLVVPVGGGTTTPSAGIATRVAEGATVTIDAEPAEGYEFVDWTSSPEVTFAAGAGEPGNSFTMPSGNVEVTANFAPIEEDPPPSLQYECTIVRDAYGVPHVFADTKVDLAFGAGYAMAQDRLWQADVMRRLPAGRLAELNLATIEEDAEMRAMWYSPEELLDIYNEWDPGADYAHLKDMIEAYVDGINLYIDDARKTPSLVPIEYTLQGLVGSLEHFTVADIVAVTVLMAWRFGGTGGNEGELYEALLTLQAMHDDMPGGAIWNDVFPLNDLGAPVTIPDAAYEAPPLNLYSPDFPDGLEASLEAYEQSRAVQEELFASLGVPFRFGSNAVPIAPELSATGNALQLGGPQMGYSVPQIVYEVGLHGDGINAVGMAFPSAGPFILIGVSEHGAWTSTTGASDVLDIRVLTLNPEDPTQYKFYTDVGEDVWEWRSLEVRNERIYGPGKSTYEDRVFFRSHYGPVIGEGLLPDTAITLHTPFFRNEIGAEQGWQLFQEATSIDEFETAVEMIWPSHNFVWSGVDGNIGYFHAGRFPVKPETADRRLPLMGDGTQEWVRVTEPEEMPRSINPEQGWLANWNNKPIADWPFAESDFHWGEGHRVQVLLGAMSMMAAGGDLTTAHLNQLNQVGGYHHTAGMSLAGDLIAAAMGSGDPILMTAGGHLVDWATAEPLPVSYVDFESPSWPADPDPTYDHPGLTIFNAWFDRIVPKVFENILPPDLIGRIKGSFGNPGNLSLLIRVLREDESLLYPGYPTGAALNAMIVEALEEAIDGLTDAHGSDMNDWLTPVRMQNYDKTGALPGNALHPGMNRGTYNHIAELRSGEGALPLGTSVIPPGQSGFMAFAIPPTPGPHCYDQVLLYASWTYKPMHLSLEDVEATETWRREFPG
jgi:penicillin G amidase